MTREFPQYHAYKRRGHLAFIATEKVYIFCQKKKQKKERNPMKSDRPNKIGMSTKLY